MCKFSHYPIDSFQACVWSREDCYPGLLDIHVDAFIFYLALVSLLGLDAKKGSAGVVQWNSGGDSEQGVEWVNHSLGAGASQPQLLVRVLVKFLQSDNSLGVHG